MCLWNAEDINTTYLPEMVFCDFRHRNVIPVFTGLVFGIVHRERERGLERVSDFSSIPLQRLDLVALGHVLLGVVVVFDFWTALFIIVLEFLEQITGGPDESVCGVV